MNRIVRVIVVLAWALWISPPLQAAERRTEYLNGATCIPYENYDASNVMLYKHYLVVGGQEAFCHLTMSSDWPVQNLTYVQLVIDVPGTARASARLCVHRGAPAEPKCSAWKPIGSNGPPDLDYVDPPNLPRDATGAFVEISFPDNTFSTVYQVVPVWTKP